MNQYTTIGVILIILGVFVVAFNAPRSKVHHVGVGPLQVEAVEQEQGDPIPLILGGIAIVAGVLLVFKR